MSTFQSTKTFQWVYDAWGVIMFEKLSSSVYMLYMLINNFYSNFVMGF